MLFKVIDFIKSYWFLILPVIEIICTILVLVLRKKPVKVVDTLKEVIVRVLPSLICEAEKTDLKGEDKKIYVWRLLHGVLIDLGYPSDCVNWKFFEEQVELILSTPQKKGIKL